MVSAQPDFHWSHHGRPCEDEDGFHMIFESQIEMMRRLFQKRKPSQTLVDWYMRRRPGDLHLYGAFGLMNPIEYDFFKQGMQRWQEYRIEEERARIDSKKVNGDGSHDPEDDTIRAPIKKVHLFLKSLTQTNEDFDQHEELLLRFEKPSKLIRAVEDALYMEGIRCDRQEGVSAVDELLCQNVYPADEKEGWIWMNKMVAGSSRSPLKLQLNQTNHALKDLNHFRLYKAVADIHDYSLHPFVTLRLNGKLQKCRLLEKIPRIQGALYYLTEEGLLDSKKLENMKQMTPEKREQEELRLKRAAVSAFLTDITQPTRDPLWIQHTMLAFTAYFHAILDKVGEPVVATRKVAVKGNDGKDRFVRVVNVSFEANVKNTGKTAGKQPAAQLSADYSK